MPKLKNDKSGESIEAPKSPLFKRRPISDFFGYVPWSEIWEVDKVLEDMSKEGAKTIQHAEKGIQKAQENIQKAQENVRKAQENNNSPLRQLKKLGY